MCVGKNKVLSKDKTNIVEPDNIKNKTPNEVNSELKAKSEPKASSGLSKASSRLDHMTFNPNMKMDLEPKSWAENGEDNSFD